MPKDKDRKTTEQLLCDYDLAILSLVRQASLNCVIDPAIQRLDEARSALAERLDAVIPHGHSQYALRTEGLP